MDFSKPGTVRARVVKNTARTDKASPTQVTLVRKYIYEQMKEHAGGTQFTDQEYWDLYYGILYVLADHGSSKRLSAHPDVVITIGESDTEESSESEDEDEEDEEAGTSEDASKKKKAAGKRPKRYEVKQITYHMSELATAILRAGAKSVRQFARAEANLIQDLIIKRGFLEMSQWHIKSKMPQDLWQWAFDVADYVTSRQPDERTQVAVAAARKNIRATEEIVNYATGDTFRSGTA